MFMRFEKVGVWSFYAGLGIAIIAAIFSANGLNTTTAWILGALGVIIGILNVTDKEVKLFLLASLTFILAASSLSSILGAIGFPGFFTRLFDAVVIFVAPGAAIVSLRALWDITKDF